MMLSSRSACIASLVCIMVALASSARIRSDGSKGAVQRTSAVQRAAAEDKGVVSVPWHQGESKFVCVEKKYSEQATFTMRKWCLVDLKQVAASKKRGATLKIQKSGKNCIKWSPLKVCLLKGDGADRRVSLGMSVLIPPACFSVLRTRQTNTTIFEAAVSTLECKFTMRLVPRWKRDVWKPRAKPEVAVNRKSEVLETKVADDDHGDASVASDSAAFSKDAQVIDFQSLAGEEVTPLEIEEVAGRPEEVYIEPRDEVVERPQEGYVEPIEEVDESVEEDAPVLMKEVAEPPEEVAAVPIEEVDETPEEVAAVPIEEVDESGA